MNRFKLLGLVTLGVVLAGVGLATWATPASANAGPHGGYTLTTSACAGCHRAHTAPSEALVKTDSVYALCTSCHGGLVSTDVVHGVLQGATNTDGVTPKKLNGGGFVQQNGANVTSRHLVDGVQINGPAVGVGTPTATPYVYSGIDTAFGSQNGDGTPVGDVGQGVRGVLECTNCHNPHGSSNYRILIDGQGGYRGDPKWVANDPDLLNWVAYQVLGTRDDAPNYGFDFTNVNDCPQVPAAGASPTPTAFTLADGSHAAGTICVQRFTTGIYDPPVNAATVTAIAGNPAALAVYGNANVPDVTKGMNGFCATCHKSYLTLSGSAHVMNSQLTPVNTVGPGTPTPINAYAYPGRQDSGDGYGNIARYRHAVDRSWHAGLSPKQPLRFAALGTDPNPAGSLSYLGMGCLMCHYAHGSSAAQTPAAGLTPEGPAGDSALLFWGNRGVCISCHQKVGPVPTLTPTP